MSDFRQVEFRKVTAKIDSQRADGTGFGFPSTCTLIAGCAGQVISVPIDAMHAENPEQAIRAAAKILAARLDTDAWLDLEDAIKEALGGSAN